MTSSPTPNGPSSRTSWTPSTSSWSVGSTSKLYYKLELSDLSTLLTVSLPIVVFITYVLLAIDSGVFPDVSFFGYTLLTVFISLAYTIVLTPYAVLTSYVLRAATVTKRTPEEGPIVWTGTGKPSSTPDTIADRRRVRGRRSP